MGRAAGSGLGAGWAGRGRVGLATVAPHRLPLHAALRSARPAACPPTVTRLSPACRQCELENATLHRDLSAALEKILNHKLQLQVGVGARWVDGGWLDAL